MILSNLLHEAAPSDMDQLLEFSVENPTERFYVVYLRSKEDKIEKAKWKIGKGYVLNGVHTRESANSADDQALHDYALIPCVDEKAAYELEKTTQNFFKSIGAHIKSDGGTEWFYISSDIDDATKGFVDAIGEITNDKNAGKKEISFRPYQTHAIKHANRAWTKGLKEFYLLYKPRAGKNVTAAGILTKYSKKNRIDTMFVQFLSLWPSAFEGMKNDCQSFKEFDKLHPVDTSDEGWEDQIEEGKINILMSSMQSLGIGLDGDESNAVVSGKLAQLAEYEYEIRVIDEADHGMRTPHAQNVLKQLPCKHELWMSGSDMYALANLANNTNSAVFTIIDEYQLIKEKVLKNRPVIQNYVTEFPQGALKIDQDLIDDGLVSRRMSVIMATNVAESGENEVRGDHGETTSAYKLRGDGWYFRGKRVEFINIGDVVKMFEVLYGINKQGRGVSPRTKGLRHGYFTLPSVRALYAFANMIMDYFPNENIRVGIANEFSSPDTIEAEVNAWIEKTEYEPNTEWYGYETIFLAVAKLVRGATVPRWTYVARMDDSIDWKIGHQRDLRCQSGDHKIGYVFDWNPLRRLECTFKMAIAIARNNDITREQAVYELIQAQPVFLQSPEQWGSPKKADYNEMVKAVNKSIQQASLGSLNGIDIGIVHHDDTKVLELAMQLSEEELKSVVIREEGTERGKQRGKRTNPTPSIPSAADHKEIEIDLKKRFATLGYTIPLMIKLTNAEYTSLSQLCNPKLIRDPVRAQYKQVLGFGWDVLKAAYDLEILNVDHFDAIIESLVVAHKEAIAV
jgi:hypothetical protein